MTTTPPPPRSRQCVTITSHGRCRRRTARKNGLCSECDAKHAARQFAVLDSYPRPEA